MPNFKPKNSKKLIIDEKKNETLDNKHKEYQDIFYKNENILLPKLNIDISDLQKQLESIDVSIEKKLEIEENLYFLKKEKQSYKKDKKEYYLKNIQHIFNYFENKKNISNGLTNEKVKSLNNFFNIDEENKNKHNNESINSVQCYFQNINETFIDQNNYIFPTDICQICKKGELIPIEYEGILVCNNCSSNTKFLIENEKPSYKEPPKEVCFYAYKRINHFREILAQFQAKETTQIPEEVLENIRFQIKKERIELSQISNKKAKDILKKLGYNKYYEHIPFIKDKLGIKPPIMSAELEETLCNLFTSIQEPYSKFCPEERVNFLNYYYTVYKLCELLDQKQFLPFFPMLKDREKRIEQDEIWKKICNELDWEFIATI
tara:strand:+ start:1851 stop:2981 length:1131 start_codon:yes stop_codon:yes gene_type:complete